MAITVNKFDLFTTMSLIKKDAKLSKFFSELYNDDFDFYLGKIKTGKLNKDMALSTKMIFEEFICVKDEYIAMYNTTYRECNNNNVKAEPKVVEETTITEVIVVPEVIVLPEVIEEVVVPSHQILKEKTTAGVEPQYKTTFIRQPQVEPETPKSDKPKRRIPKSEILKMIAENGGNPTENQRTLLQVGDLKNLVARLHNRAKQDLFTDEDARTVMAAIDTLKKRVLPLIEKK